MHTILQTIAQLRSEYRPKESREIAESFGNGEQKRDPELPLVDYFGTTGLICELKKASPSRGVINTADPFDDIIDQYVAGGADRFSVLTEQNHFLGNWQYLHSLKRRYPDKAFLRKDFLFCRSDIRDSWLIGADAVLLIAEMLADEQLRSLIPYAHSLGLQVLCEAHTAEQIQRILQLEELPDAIGINARDLTTFTVNPRVPYMLRQMIPPDIPVITESGVKDAFAARLAGNAGFSGILIGETLMRSSNRPSLVAAMTEAYCKGMNSPPNFFTRLMQLYRQRPLVKICGITSRADAEAAVAAGADLLGFILADSKRRISIDDLLQFRDLPVLKVAVVMDPDSAMTETLRRLIAEEVLDGVQLHGNEDVELLHAFDGNAYKVIIPTEPQELSEDRYAPLSLIDRPKGAGNDSLGIPFSKQYRQVLHHSFIAGGITPENLEEVLDCFDPLLIDIASGVEKCPGIKEHDKIIRIFTTIRNKYGEMV